MKKIPFILPLFILLGCSPSDKIDVRLDEKCSSGQSSKEILGYSISGTLKNVNLWKTEDFCSMANEIKNESLSNASNSMDILCENTIKKVSEISKNGEEVVRALKMTPDPSVQSILKILSICTNPEQKKQEINEIAKEISVKLYSIGSMRVDNELCPAFLIETETNSTKGKSIGYSLAGSGSCKGMQTTNALTYHPELNIHGPLPGEFFQNTLKYDGDIPQKWMYNGNTFKMFVR